MMYNAIYTCPLYGTKIKFGAPHEIPYDALPELCAEVVKNQMFMGNPALYQAPMYIPHRCKDSGAGLARFSGFSPVE